MMSTPIEEHPLLVSFVNGDDAYRNSRFKLIPYISKVGVKDYLYLVLLFVCPMHSYLTFGLAIFSGLLDS
jgi:hypothetical protein